VASTAEGESGITENVEETPQDFSLPQETDISYQDVVEVYDEVLHVSDSPGTAEDLGEMFSDLDVRYHELGQEFLPRNNYGSDGEDLTGLGEMADGNVLVIATGLEGRHLPHYSEIDTEDLERAGNWWDNPLGEEVDYLMDEESYSGAVRTPPGAEIEVKRMEDDYRKFIYMTES
jgi:hypothetical protein